MLKRRYEILLPLQYNDGDPVSDADLKLTRDELLNRYEAISVQPGTVAGIWIHERMRYDDCFASVESGRTLRLG
jgi:hypothetical protein